MWELFTEACLINQQKQMIKGSNEFDELLVNCVNRIQ